MLQLGTRGKGDAAHADVLGGDVVFLALVATGEGEAEGAQVIQLHAIAVEEGIGEVFSKVLLDAGVYKRTPEGKAAFMRFIDHINS